MRFNREDIGIEKLVKPYRNKPKLSAGSIIELLYNDEDTPLSGCRTMKKGKYKITNIREPFMSHIKQLVYVIKSNRENATYEWAISTEAIDYSIDKGYIELVEPRIYKEGE